MLRDDEREAILAVLDYMWSDEEHDYEQQDDEGRQNHILNALRVLREMVE